MAYLTKYKTEKIPKLIPYTPTIQQIDVELLKTLFSIQTPSMDMPRQTNFKRFVLKWLKQNNVPFRAEEDEYGSLYITRGNAKIYPCVVSHIDTVHDYNPALQIINTQDLVFGIDTSTGKQHGIGADPKNGVYFAMQMLKLNKAIKVVLFLDEEVGCIGSSNANIKFFKDCSFVCQLDRRSFTNDFIEYTNGIEVVSDSFKAAVQPILNKFQYQFNNGSVTDVGELVHSGIGICAFNFSNGSFNEHMDYETCSIPHLLNACNAAHEIILTLGNKVWKHKPYTYPKAKTKYVDAWDAGWDWDQLYSKVPSKKVDAPQALIESFMKDCLLDCKHHETLYQGLMRYKHEPYNVENLCFSWRGYVTDFTEEQMLNGVLNTINTMNVETEDVKDLVSDLTTAKYAHY